MSYICGDVKSTIWVYNSLYAVCDVGFDSVQFYRSTMFVSLVVDLVCSAVCYWPFLHKFIYISPYLLIKSLRLWSWNLLWRCAFFYRLIISIRFDSPSNLYFQWMIFSWPVIECFILYTLWEPTANHLYKG